MMLSPKKVTHRKMQRRAFKVSGKAGKGNTVAFGEFGLVAAEAHWLTARQIEAARVSMTRRIKRGGKVWIRIFPDVPYTKKPAETRQGKGKGSPEMWVAPVKMGTVLFEIAGVEQSLAMEAMLLAAQKLPIKAKFVTRQHLG